jgi:hypothetical protein
MMGWWSDSSASEEDKGDESERLKGWSLVVGGGKGKGAVSLASSARPKTTRVTRPDQ